MFRSTREACGARRLRRSLHRYAAQDNGPPPPHRQELQRLNAPPVRSSCVLLCTEKGESGSRPSRAFLERGGGGRGASHKIVPLRCQAALQGEPEAGLYKLRRLLAPRQLHPPIGPAHPKLGRQVQMARSRLGQQKGSHARFASETKASLALRWTLAGSVAIRRHLRGASALWHLRCSWCPVQLGDRHRWRCHLQMAGRHSPNSGPARPWPSHMVHN
mmetsp:Transcript_10975/g.24172  ORF Transcript_10975/g.24172 Transcript_10975/m.24172 type:complete len:217 (+) Transcript_10975:1571-2221(+)